MIEINALLEEIKGLIYNNLDQVKLDRYKISYKEDGSPVTLADKFLESLIHSYLKNKLPNLRFVGEETFDFKWEENDTYLAILDPIDGTENFCSGLKEWGVSLSIWHKSDHLGSMLLMPELGECLKTGDKLPKIYSRITGFSSSYNEQIGQGIANAIEYRVTGCAVYNLFNVIRGSFAHFINPKGAYVWDLLPGIMLALEHDCEILLNDEPYDGKLLNPTEKYRVNIQHRYDIHSR